MRAKYNHLEYFENISNRLKAIRGADGKPQFYKSVEQSNIEELEQKMSSASGIILIAIDASDASFSWKNSDSLMQQPSYSFAIAQQTTIGDTETIRTAQANSKENAMQVIAKMMADYHSYTKGMDLLDPSSFDIRGFGPLRSSFYGVLVSFSFNQGVDYTINSELWD